MPRGNFRPRTEEEKRRASTARMGVLNPNWKGGSTLDPERKAEYLRAWRAKNIDGERDRRYKIKYGITLEEYEALLARQGGLCAICGASPGRRRLDVDHNHETGTVRGLLCEMCNKGIGALQDDVEILKRATEYLSDAITQRKTA